MTYFLICIRNKFIRLENTDFWWEPLPGFEGLRVDGPLEQDFVKRELIGVYSGVPQNGHSEKWTILYNGQTSWNGFTFHEYNNS